MNDTLYAAMQYPEKILDSFQLMNYGMKLDPNLIIPLRNSIQK